MTPKYFLTLGLACALPYLAQAQVSRPGPMISCPVGHGQVSTPGGLRPPGGWGRGGSTQSRPARFEVMYTDFPDDARAAFEQAARIWEGELSSEVPIRVTAEWVSLPSQTLASAGPTLIFRDFDDAPLADTWYPVALAEKIVGRPLNADTAFDIRVRINDQIAWSFNAAGVSFPDRFDLVSVVLHELAHGLGIISTARAEGDQGAWGNQGFPLVFDAFVVNGQRELVIDSLRFANPSAELLAQWTSEALFFEGPQAGNRPVRPRLFAPVAFSQGSSVAHLDERTYPAGDADALMTPQIARGEVIRLPGPLLVDMLGDLGWTEAGPAFALDTVFLRIYPNPLVDRRLTLDAAFGAAVASADVRVFDATGRLVAQQSVQERQSPNLRENSLSGLVLRLDALRAGLYFVEVRGGSRRLVQRLVVR